MTQVIANGTNGHASHMKPTAFSFVASRSRPATIDDETQLDEMLSEPTAPVIDVMGRLEGDILVLGAGGKMGPTLARMARVASDRAGRQRRVIGVARFSQPNVRQQLETWGVETIPCDLLDEGAIDNLPDAANVIYMPAMKFGSSNDRGTTWAVNSFLPGLVCRKYRQSRIVAFSTGNVYGLTSPSLGGSLETDGLNPTGEYAMSALGRERIFEYFSREQDTPVSILRLNYAVELRYGVLVDLVQQIHAGETVDLSMGNVNVIWQGDANAMTLASLAYADAPPFVLNLAGPELLSVRRLALQIGERLGRPVAFQGVEQGDSLLSNGQRGHQLMGYPQVGVQQLVDWTCAWVSRGGKLHGKPTHFQTRDGKF